MEISFCYVHWHKQEITKVGHYVLQGLKLIFLCDTALYNKYIPTNHNNYYCSFH